MKKILSSNIKYVILGLIVLILIASGIMMGNVKVNYDMTKYLPEDSNTKQAIEIMETEFGNYASVELMIEDVEMAEAVLLKQEILKVDGVLSVAWLDNYQGLPQGLEEQLASTMYKDGNALYTILFEDDSYRLKVEETINKIRETLKDEKISFRGGPLYNIDSRNITEGEISRVMLVIIPIIILILLIAAKSWVEPLIILLVLGVAILINQGTNIIFSDVSYMTQMMAMALQLAISLDYSLFLIHRYYEEKDNGMTTIEAVVTAVKGSFTSILGSALTTIVGFTALLFMQYTIGSDMGLVMGKGIVFSFLSTIFFMPILIVIFAPLLEKTMKRKKNLSSETSSKKKFSIDGFASIFYNKKYITLAAFVVVAAVGFVFQSKIDFLYADSEITDEASQLVMEEANINEVFGVNSPVIILVPNDDIEAEGALMLALMQNENISSIQSISVFEQLLQIPRDFIPDEIKSNFIGPNYTRIIVQTDIVGESDAMYDFSYGLEETVKDHYDEYYFAGIPTSTTEIKDVVSRDSTIVSIASIVGVGLVVMFIFRSISLPLILLLVIEATIWINMSIVYFQGVQLLFIGYLIVQTLLLGATIDYAVLLTSRYKEFRKTNSKFNSVSKAIKASGRSIITSSLVLAVAGYAEGLMSNISSIQEIGTLIGRGALISLLLVIVALPSMLLIFDNVISKTSYKANFYNE